MFPNAPWCRVEDLPSEDTVSRMTLSDADRFLLQAVREGREEGWSQLVDRFQGRLCAFARGKLPSPADAEDVVQESLIAFLRGLGGFEGRASLETYLFSILRRKIADHYRLRRVNVCLLQDLFGGGAGGGDDDSAGPLERAPSPDLTASQYVRRDEQQERVREALAAALTDVVDRLKESLNFRNLQIFEMLFYCQLRNKDVAQVAGLPAGQVAGIKHRWLTELRGRLSGAGAAVGDISDTLLTEVWEATRPSCPKRSTVGAFLLGTLEADWAGYVGFHLHRLGCRFCLANLEDLKIQNDGADQGGLRARIMESTVGWLPRKG